MKGADVGPPLGIAASRRAKPTLAAVAHELRLQAIADESRRWEGLAVFREHRADEAIFALSRRDHRRREHEPTTLRSGAIATLARVARS